MSEVLSAPSPRHNKAWIKCWICFFAAASPPYFDIVEIPLITVPLIAKIIHLCTLFLLFSNIRALKRLFYRYYAFPCAQLQHMNVI